MSFLGGIIIEGKRKRVTSEAGILSLITTGNFKDVDFKTMSDQKFHINLPTD